VSRLKLQTAAGRDTRHGPVDGSLRLWKDSILCAKKRLFLDNLGREGFLAVFLVKHGTYSSFSSKNMEK
jgi:hypothetical protein